MSNTPISSGGQDNKYVPGSDEPRITSADQAIPNIANLYYYDSFSPTPSARSSAALHSMKARKTTKKSDLREMSTKTKWSTRKKVLIGLLIALIVCAVIAAIILAVLLTQQTATTSTTRSTTTSTTASSPVVSVYWSFDNITTDLYGVYNGQLVNGATYSPVSNTQPYVGNGRALSLVSSSNQSFQVSTPFFNLANTSFTIEAWIYSTTSYTGDNGIFGQCQCSTCANQCLYLIVRASSLYVGFTSNDLIGVSTLTINTWYHVAFVYNYQTNQQILYLNGVQDNIKSNAQPYQGTNGTIRIGSTQVNQTINYFNGYIDNLKVITRAKSATEILWDASVIAYYPFDISSANYDNGPNGLNGTLVNTVTVLGRVNQAMRFTGSSSYFQAYGFYQAGDGVYPYRPFSISMWINPTSTASSTILQQSSTQTGGTCINMVGFFSSGGITGQLAVQAYSYPTIYGPFVTTNTWTHFSWTYGTTVGYKLYVNGVFYGSTGNVTQYVTTGITWLEIGYAFSCTANNIGNNGYQGSIDEVYVHSRELSQADVTALANP